MRLLCLFCAALTILVFPGYALVAQAAKGNEFPTVFRTGEFPIKGSDKLFTRDLFRLTHCMAKNDNEKVRALMVERSKPWSGQLVQEMANRNRSCLTRGTMLTGKKFSFAGGLASGLFLEKYKDKEIPAYRGTPQVFTMENYADLNRLAQEREYILALSECAFRLDPQGVKNFLDTEAYSKKSGEVRNLLLPAFETCLSGTEMPTFTRAGFRGFIALAAYYVDLAYESHTNGAA